MNNGEIFVATIIVLAASGFLGYIAIQLWPNYVEFAPESEGTSAGNGERGTGTAQKTPVPTASPITDESRDIIALLRKQRDVDTLIAALTKLGWNTTEIRNAVKGKAETLSAKIAAARETPVERPAQPVVASKADDGAEYTDEAAYQAAFRQWMEQGGTQPRRAKPAPKPEPKAAHELDFEEED